MAFSDPADDVAVMGTECVMGIPGLGGISSNIESTEAAENREEGESLSVEEDLAEH